MRKLVGAASFALLMTAGLPFAQPAGATSTFSFSRLAGVDRYATAAAVATTSFSSAPDVVVATGEAYPDALAGNYLAGGKSAPVLLVNSGSVPQATTDALRSLGASRVTILGQTAAVSTGVETQLQNSGYAVSRIGGRDRYETARMIAEAPGALAVGSIGGARTALVATGENFPDAIAAGPAAWALKLPVLLTASAGLSPDASTAFDDLGIKNVVILGGTSAVSATVSSQIGAKGITVTRIGGSNRFDTAAQFATWELSNGFTSPPTHVNVATGLSFPDALTGGPHAGKERAPVILSGSVPQETAAWLSTYASSLTGGDIFGGTQAVSDADASAMAADAGNTSGGGSSSTPSGSGTVRPQLTSATVASNNPGVSSTVKYCFTKPVVALDSTLFHVYDASGVASAKNGDVGSATVDATTNTCMNVVFSSLPSASAAAAETVATIDIGAVKDVLNNQNPEGNAPMSSSTTFFSAGSTAAPDLQSVSGFVANGPNTDVTFTFDSAATSTGGGGFRLVQPNNTLVTCAYTSGTGTTALVATCPGALTTANVVRGVVLTGTVSNVSAQNPLEAYHITTTATGPTITAATLDLNAVSGATPVDRVTLTFNQLVNDPSANNTKFVTYNSDATEHTCFSLGCTILLNASNAAQVSLDFPDGTLSSAVGVNLLAGAVTGFQSTLPNQPDAMGMTNSGGSSTAAGFTVGPDLTAVTIVAIKDSFGVILGYTATYTFDENLSGAGPAGRFRLYDQDGTVVPCTTVAVGTTATTQSTASCTAFAGTTDSVKLATVGTVDDTSVVAFDAGPSNVEGARGTARSGF
jgi:putative cell wall-binding protein